MLERSLDVSEPMSTRRTSQRNKVVSRSPGMFTVVQEKGSSPDCRLVGIAIVDGRFHQRNTYIPIILSRVDICPENGLYRVVIHTFILPISLRVKG